MADRPVYAKAKYDEVEASTMSDRAKEIANYTTDEWCMEWDRLTSIIRKKYKSQIANIERRKREGY